jgi:hypothetical protein
MLPPLNPKMFIKYTRWLDKNNIALCDGSTLPPMGIIDIIIQFIVMFGLFGGVYFSLMKLPSILIDRHKKKKERSKDG